MSALATKYVGTSYRGLVRTSTLAIAKTTVGRNATKKDVAPSLYKLEKEGRVVKSNASGSPCWMLPTDAHCARPAVSEGVLYAYMCAEQKKQKSTHCVLDTPVPDVTI